MKISLIIPVFNGESYIADSIYSALDQSLVDFEVIVVNDGSTDNTSQILARIADENHNLHVINKDNEGPAKAREVGALRATGEFLVFLDGDDLIYQNSLVILYNLAKANNLDIGIYNYKVFNENIDVTGLCENKDIALDKTYLGKDFLSDNMYTAYNWDKIWRRDFYINHVLSGFSGFYYEDQLPVLKGLFHAKRVAKLNIECVAYRNNENSTTRRKITTEHYNALRVVILDYIKFLTSNSLLNSNCALRKLGHMRALLNDHRNELKLETDEEIRSAYLDLRKNLDLNYNGFFRLARKVGIINSTYLISNEKLLLIVFCVRKFISNFKSKLTVKHVR
ncbi:glycosyltransferase [Vibrio alginolyticus]|uniref:glycosyltransferase family 2 protein n=1 Tax=Vibrio alginolyticus TaxID=663 RepID=UPI00102DA792|nr:glycosyltransferase [Vibrio alginolyticus]EMB9235179.1 glycosyltransferase [Vibrio alginolyticus]RZV23025.1 glycosyltransferase [Vibrio alginolyticus]